MVAVNFYDELFQKKEKKPGDKIIVKKDCEENLKKIKEALTRCDDVIYREFKVGRRQDMKFALVCTDGLANKDLLNESIMEDLMYFARMADMEPGTMKQKIYEIIKYGSISVAELKETDDLNEAIDTILSGDTVLIMDGWDQVLLVASKGWPMRSVEKPETEMVIRGPSEGFTETFRTNTALVRRRIRDPRFKISQLQIGKRSKTDIAILYIEEIVNKDVLRMVKQRIDKIQIDAILESGYIEQLIEDEWRSPFPQIQNTQRPDVVAAALYEGRVGIIVDNTPYALLAPATITTLLQSSEDYYERFFIATAIRILRALAVVTSLFLPAFYIAITSYHPGMIPTDLALYISGSRLNVPFPAFIEAFIMEASLELLREAGVRLPGSISATIGIIGGLVLGQAAVQAGIVSPLMVIIVALTAMAAYTSPSYSFAISFRLLRFFLMAFAAVFGLYGMVLSTMLILIHMCNLKSFGVPYLSPMVASEMTWKDFKDFLIRAPLHMMRQRPQFLHRSDSSRLAKTRTNKGMEEDDSRGKK
jgi:spore germination protein